MALGAFGAGVGPVEGVVVVLAPAIPAPMVAVNGAEALPDEAFEFLADADGAPAGADRGAAATGAAATGAAATGAAATGAAATGAATAAGTGSLELGDDPLTALAATATGSAGSSSVVRVSVTGCGPRAQTSGHPAKRPPQTTRHSAHEHEVFPATIA